MSETPPVHGLSTGAKIGIVISVILIIVAFIIGIYYMTRTRSSSVSEKSVEKTYGYIYKKDLWNCKYSTNKIECTGKSNEKNQSSLQGSEFTCEDTTDSWKCKFGNKSVDEYIER